MSLFSLSIEEATTPQDFQVFFDQSDSVAFCGTLLKQFYRARALLVDERPVIEYESCSACTETNQITVPGITITTLRSLIESSFANTINDKLGVCDFSCKLKERLEKLVN